MSKRPAFTMIELLLVLAILTLIVGISVGPVRSWISRSEVDRTASALVRLVQEGQLRATREGRSWSLSVNGRPSMLSLAPTDAKSNDRTSPIRKLDDNASQNIFNTRSTQSLQYDSRFDRSLVHPLPASMRVAIRSPLQGAANKELRISPTGLISDGEVQLYQGDRLVQTFLTDRLTGGIQRSVHEK